MKILKKSVTILLFIFFVMFSMTAFAQNNVSVYIDNQKLEFEVEPRILNGSTMVPLRGIFDAFDAKIRWDDDTRTITSFKESGEVIFITIDHHLMYVGNKAIKLPTPAVIIENTTFVPLRAISETFGCKIGWDETDKTVSIIKDKSKYTMLYTDNNRKRSFLIDEALDYINNGWLIDDENLTNIYDDSQKPVLSVGGQNVYIDELIYYYAMLRQNSDDITEDNFNELMESVINEIKINKSLGLLAYINNSTLTKEDYKLQITDYVSSIKYALGEQFDEILASSYLTETLFEEITYSDALLQKLYNETTSEGEVFDMSDSSYVMEIAKQNNLIRAKHILIPFDETQSEEIEKFAKDVLTLAKSGEDFDILIENFNADPGMSAYPDGYYFIEGEMVDEFYNAANSLKEGEISDLVQTAYGYHIIQRLPLEEQSLMNSNFANNVISEAEYGNMINAIKTLSHSLKVNIDDDFVSKYDYNTMENMIIR